LNEWTLKKGRKIFTKELKWHVKFYVVEYGKRCVQCRMCLKYPATVLVLSHDKYYC